MPSSNLDFFEQRANKFSNPCHYLDFWKDMYAVSIRKKSFFSNIAVDGKVVGDFGCGNGQWASDFIWHGAKRVIGIDQSATLIERAILRNAFFEQNDEVSFAQRYCDCFYRDYVGIFDMVFMATVWNFLDPSIRANVLVNTFRYLKDGGSFVILDYFPKKVPEYQKGFSYKWVWGFQDNVVFIKNFGFILESVHDINFIDTSFFHFFGSSYHTYRLTRFLDSFVGIVPSGFCKYRILTFAKHREKS